MTLDNCPTCDKRITDYDPFGIETESGQRWCNDHHLLHRFHQYTTDQHNRRANLTVQEVGLLLDIVDA